jgi:hypothetical protein
LASVQEAVVPPLVPAQDQVLFVPQVVDPLSRSDVPIVQTPADAPHRPLFVLFAVQEAVVPPLVPAHDQVHGPLQATELADPTPQRLVVGIVSELVL